MKELTRVEKGGLASYTPRLRRLSNLRNAATALFLRVRPPSRDRGRAAGGSEIVRRRSAAPVSHWKMPGSVENTEGPWR